MKKFSTTLLLMHSLLTITAQAPELEWVGNFGAPGSFNDSSRDIFVDNKGFIYLTGAFQDMTDFDPGPEIYNLISLGSTDIYVLKLDNSGNFIWAKQFGGTEGQSGRSIAVDNSGNVYSTGGFTGVVDFDPGPGINELTASDPGDMYISKLNPEGNLLWVRQFSGTGFPNAQSIALDEWGNIYTTGWFDGVVDFDPGPEVFNLNTSNTSFDQDIFISKLNSDGVFIWAIQIGGKNADVSSAIHVDLHGNILTTGNFRDTVDFDPGPGVFNLSTVIGGSYSFVSKLDTEGNFIWAKSFTGTNPFLSSAGFDIVSDTFGNTFSVGVYEGTIDFDPSSEDFLLTSKGNTDIYISKLDVMGNFAWARSIGNDAPERGNSITIDKFGHIYTTGSFGFTVDFDPGPEVSTLTATPGSTDIFISKLNKDGHYEWAGHLGGQELDIGNAITVDKYGNIYTTGEFIGLCDFDPGPGFHNLTSSGIFDAFVHKMRQCPITVQIESEGITSICQGEELLLSTSLSCPISEAVYLWSIGDTTENISVSPEMSSAYVVTITYNSGCSALDTLEIMVEDAPEAMILEVPEICPGDTSTLEAVGGQDYEWSNEDNTSITIVTPTANTSYTVTITDENGCTDSDSILVEVYELPDISINGNLEVCPGDTTTLYASGGVEYLWNTGQTTDSVLDSVFQNTVYTVMITDENNCTNTASVIVLVDESFCPSCAVMPNAFTPDGDGLNDYFSVLPEGDSEVLEFRIYNRFGNLVHNNVMPWTGVFEGQPQPSDLYLYYLKVRTYCGVEELKGEVLLVR